MMKNRWICLLMAMAFAVLLPLSAQAAIPSEPMTAFYANDYADVISSANEQTMVSIGTQLEDETTAQLVAVTVNFLDGLDIEEYGYQLFNSWGLGQADENNGVLLIMSVGDRDIRIIVGKGLESSLSPATTGALLDDYAIPYLADDDFSQGMLSAYEALADKIASIYGVNLTQSSQPVSQTNSNSYGNNNSGYYDDYGYQNTSSGGGFGGVMEIIIGIIVLVAIVAVVGSIFRSRGNGGSCMSTSSCCLLGWLAGRGGGGGRPYGGGRSMWMPPPPRTGGRSTRPPGGRSTGGFGGGGSFGGGRTGGGGSAGRSSGPRSGGGGGTRGGGAGRKF